MQTTKYLPLLIFGCASFVLWGQDSTLLKYQNNWQTFHDKEAYDQAIEQAQSIYNLGKQIDDPNIMANAAYWMGQSYLAKPNLRRLERKQALRTLRNGLRKSQLNNDRALELHILGLLKNIAQLDKEAPYLEILNQQIEAIEAVEAQKKAEAAKESLNAQIAILDSENMKLTARLDSLNAAQMKTALFQAEQKNMLDSIKMLRMEETFQLEKKEMALKDQATQLELQENQLELQDNELQLQSTQRNLFLAMVGLMAVLVIGVILRSLGIRRYTKALESKNVALQQERAKSEDLLLNILPAAVAEELKNTGNARARRYERATVMFTDFQNFSGIAKSMAPESLVKELDVYFKAFDEIISKHQLEKIKTIGDAYLCVGGLPDQENNKPEHVIRAAFDIQQLLQQLKNERIANQMPFFEARIGIHTGPLVAGVVGSKKFAYDIWGDTVNIAARMETHGEPWRVNVSETTYQLVKPHFDFEYRGIIPIKNRGEMGMYFAVND